MMTAILVAAVPFVAIIVVGGAAVALHDALVARLARSRPSVTVRPARGAARGPVRPQLLPAGRSRAACVRPVGGATPAPRAPRGVRARPGRLGPWPATDGSPRP